MGKIKDSLKGKLSKDQLGLVPNSYDIIGDILIFRAHKDLKKKSLKIIAKKLLELNGQVNVVAMQDAAFDGKYRLRKIKILAGDKRKETLHVESSVKLKLDVEKCYFSPRLSNERLRIAKLVKKNEDVLVMFSGVGVYPLVIAANSDVNGVYGIELNKVAHKYALENLKLNRYVNINLIQGDVKKVKLSKKFDRIVMPLPMGAEDFLGLALKYVKKKGVVHLYSFARENEFNKIRKKYSKFKQVKIVKAGIYGPGIYRICIDFQVT